MTCSQTLSYTIKKGDSLYQIARSYNTTVPMILNLNPGIAPNNLQVGMQILICPGEEYVDQTNSINFITSPNSDGEIALIKNMRRVWSQHVYWTRMLIISTAERLKDLDAVTNRLLQNPNDIANVFADYYSQEDAKAIANVITEHLQIGAALITAIRDRDNAKSNMLNQQWYQNADKMAEVFSEINPYYNREELRNMFHRHLDITIQEAAMRLSGNYSEDIRAFDNAEQQILEMADYFVNGILQQFPQHFR